MEDNSLQISLRRINHQVAILDLCGRVTGTDARELEKHLLSLREAGVNCTILNFLDVKSIDDVGIGSISSALDAGTRIKILHPNTDCRNFLSLRGITGRVGIFYSEEDALRDSGDGWTLSQERRNHGRIEFEPPRSVEIHYQNSQLPGLLLNVSEGGALLGYVDTISPPIPKDLRISLRLRYLGMVEFTGQTVSLRERSDMHTLAIKILHNEKSRHILQRICDDPATTLPTQE